MTRVMRLPQSLRSRLFAGTVVTVLVSLVVTVVAGALLTRRSLEQQALSQLARQVDLIAAQRAREGGHASGGLGEFLATEQQRLAILTAQQAELLLPESAARGLRERRTATGSLQVGESRFLYAARRKGVEAVVLLREADRQASEWTPFVLGLGLAAFVGALLAAVVAYVLARAVARPVARVAQASRSLASGTATAPLPLEGPAELASLATSFNDLARELEHTQAAERSFLLSVGHELKTPLTVVRGHAEALADGVLTPEAAGSAIEREARRLERLIQDLLDLARLRRHTFSVTREDVELEAVARAVSERFRRQATQLGVALEVHVESGAWALADTDRVVQVLSNLVENALRSTPAGGTVTVLTAPGRVDVVDDGPGLAESDVQRAFERFYLHDRHCAGGSVGTGLGLAIVHELAEAMGGSATVHSVEGVGSTFSVHLPLCETTGSSTRVTTDYVRLTHP